MASKAQRTASTESPQPASEQEKRNRAYEIYLERGFQPGSEVDDWLRAERELSADYTKEGFPMTNEQIIRNAYERAEKVDVQGFVECFTPDGTFTDMSIGVTYRGPDGPTGIGKTVEVYAKAFPDMHRELYRFFNVGDVVVVELALQGTHKGPLPTPMGVLPATGKRMDAPCCDVFRLVNGKILSFNCYPSGTVIFAQLGVLSNIEAAIAHS